MTIEESTPETSGPVWRCPRCGATGQPGDRFCEADGTPLAPAVPDAAAMVTLDACGCGARLADAAGYCGACGRAIVTAPFAVGAAAPWLAVATDRGQRHTTNQDAVGAARVTVGAEEWALAVVCDGVSSSDHAELAAAAAVRAALRALREWALTTPERPAVAALGEAVAAAQAAIVAVAAEAPPPAAGLDLPSATIVAAVATPAEVTLAWLGDSRAYWIAAGEARLLTGDHAWGHEEIAAGRLTAAAARSDPRFRALTRWLGPDGGGAPALATLPRPAEGLLLLTTDGLWGYADGERLARLVAETGTPGDLTGLARGLVEFAVRAGGRDNIAVALVGARREVEAMSDESEAMRGDGANVGSDESNARGAEATVGSGEANALSNDPADARGGTGAPGAGRVSDGREAGEMGERGGGE